MSAWIQLRISAKETERPSRPRSKIMMLPPSGFARIWRSNSKTVKAVSASMPICSMSAGKSTAVRWLYRTGRPRLSLPMTPRGQCPSMTTLVGLSSFSYRFMSSSTPYSQRHLAVATMRSNAS